MNRPAKINLFLKSLALALDFAVISASARTATALGDMPLFFEANSSGQFSARGSDSQFLISPVQSEIILRKNESETATVQMRLVGANPSAQICGDGEMPGKINYLTGNNPAQWRSGVPIFSKVCVGEIYPGINLVYYGKQKRLEYDFNIAPGANPDSILIRFAGADKISINTQGELVLKVGDSEIRQPAPVVYQMAGGEHKEIGGGYKMVDANTITFAVGNYDRALPLIIDPTIAFSTYFGGTAGETAWSVALNPTDNSIYVAGQTFSKRLDTNGPAFNPFATDGAYQTSYNGGKYTGDAFVARFDTNGNPMYLTYLGGAGDNAAYGVAVDTNGDAFVTGFTDAADFPVKNAIPGHTTISGKKDKHVKLYPADVFVAELDAGGSNLLYSTYLGGESSDAAYGIALDSSDNAYITGFTFSTNFPVQNALQSRLACKNTFYNNANAFVAEITNGGGALVFSTYLGGTNYDIGKSIAVDSSNYIYVAGFTLSTNFPTTNWISGSFTNLLGTNLFSYNGRLLNGSTNKLNFASDAFVTKYFPSGTNYFYSTLLGGTNNDGANSIAVDGSGAAYVTGWTVSTNFPNTIGVIGITNNLTNTVFITTNVFLAKITNGIYGTPAGIDYSVVFGGNASDIGYGVAVDKTGDAFVTGFTDSPDFPTTNALDSTIGGVKNKRNKAYPGDAFVAELDSGGSNLLYSTYLG
ncbi:MAG TPA: SBBP repeat-containing protein, partial [Dongiaceae bacterium]|nr:SBBP repeat-containing protein [Dongiaceae bacterium]